MKFTSEDLMKAMGLQVGDKIKFCDDIFELKKVDGLFMFFNTKNKNELFWVVHLIDQEFEILPRPKRVGDLKCEYYVNCDDGCPLCWLCTHYDRNMLSKEIREDFNLYDILNAHNFDFADEIYDLLKARLDKEVVEE